MPGPVPNRESDLARPRERKGSGQQGVTKGVSRPTSIPHADPEWHKIARMMWDSAKKSGGSDFYEQSDWALLYSLCDDLSKLKKSGRPSSQWAAVIYQQLGNLLVSEGERRRLRIELHDPETEESSQEDEVMDEYADALGVVTPFRR